MLNHWVEKNRHLAEVRTQADELTKLHNDFFEHTKIDHPGFADELPENFNSDELVTQYELLWATLRHDLFKLVEEKHQVKDSQDLKKVGVEALSIYYGEMIGKLNQLRAEIFNLRLS